ncbi:AraC family transcriptional regulator [Snuella sedimenti]|uniref:AraC family transcriptional regulator n=1 Tax=Snuella sedimenti TaxID=2798802 RepID=A0A8J7J0A0_9FLAO|nr:AraC family transcriptional regulator [Snuella sedimenti]MBJ6367132.1 AraC family transcriptional regulator [Snuella sedimenti]
MDEYTLKEGFLGQKMIVLPDAIKNRVKNNPISGNFYVTDLGYFPKAHHHFRKRKKNHGDYIFIYCTEGRGWITVEKEKIEIFPNQYIIIPKQLAHSYSASVEDPWSIYWMHFNGSIAEDLYLRYKTTHEKSETIPFVDHRLKLFHQIFDLLKSNYTDYQLEYANILSLNFISTYIFSKIDIPFTHQNKDNLVGAIIDFLNNNINKTYKSKDIAKEFKLSPSYLHTIFKKRTGYSPIHFFNLKKIQKACEYLNFTDLSIKEISFKIGIQDPLYFSRLFKKYMGTSPKTYKNNQNHK